MEHLQLEVFDLQGTGSKYAVLEQDQSITIVDTSEVFASGDVWSQSFRLNIPANAHIFGSAGEMHGARLHEQINKRRARLWVEGLPLYLGYLKLDDEVEIDGGGNIDINFESGQKTFEEMIEGTSATEVSVGDVPIGIALNRQREGTGYLNYFSFSLTGLAAYANKDPRLDKVDRAYGLNPQLTVDTPYLQRWPKMVKSHGRVYDENFSPEDIDFTNVQTPYDAGHPFCNINICYPLKATNKEGEEVAGRGYTVRLAHGKPTTDGGDNETRYNNAPNFYLLYFMDRLFKDLNIHVLENQALNVEDLRRVFLLNYGCHYEEIENDGKYFDAHTHTTPEEKKQRYGQYYMPLVNSDGKRFLVKNWDDSSIPFDGDELGKVLLRDVIITNNGETLLQIGSVEGVVQGSMTGVGIDLKTSNGEHNNNAYSAYMAYATGDNYPNVEISEIVEAMKSMFGIRLIFSNDYSTVNIVLLRNILRNKDIQDIRCDIISEEKVENSIRGFRMTYGQGTENTTFYYKGFADMFIHKAVTWKDTSDKHDYSQWDLDAEYDFIKQYVSAMNKICYVTPVNGNAYATKVDEEEDVLFPSLFEMAGFMDAEDGDCSGDNETISEIQATAAPVIMNEIGPTYASLFEGELKAPSPDDDKYAQWISTFGRFTTSSIPYSGTSMGGQRVSGKLDVYIKEGFKIRMEDNYGISNGGTPFDEADPGLRFGIMRSSGDDAFVRYGDDPKDGEGNDCWDIEPGSESVCHPDTCNNYGELWDYDGELTVDTPEKAIDALATLYPNSNVVFDVEGEGFVTDTHIWHFCDNNGKKHYILFAKSRSISDSLISYSEILIYSNTFDGLSIEEALAQDAADKQLIIEIDTTPERATTCERLCGIAYGGYGGSIVIDNGVGSIYGRFSLKLRAEKLNPYYDKTLPDIVRTKQEAATAMTRIYKTANTDLLDRPIVDNATMRTAGWECPGDGYATVFSIGQGVMYSDGKVHEILWTPIKPNGTVKTPAQMQTYVNSFNNLASSEIITHDTEHLILDIDTSEQRAETLHELQALYYEADEAQATPVDIRPVNRRYLEITTPALRGRGLCDQFYKEYSFWIRNARIAKRTVHMELAQLLSIDKTKRVKIGDITGFIRKMQYEVNNKTGLGLVTMEIMYI